MKNIALFLFILCLNSPSLASDKNHINLNSWNSLPVLHDGRIKPIDSFAKIHLKMFSNQSSLDNLSANEWLALSLFDPASAAEIPVFKIRDNKNYNLPETKNRLYSYIDVSTVIAEQQDTINDLLEIRPSNWTAEQARLITLYEHYILYTQILRSLTALLPLNIDDRPKTVLDFADIQKDLNEKVKEIVRQKGTDLNQYNDEEKEISFLSYQLNILNESAANNVLFRIIPDTKSSNKFYAPWEIIRENNPNETTQNYLKIWQDLALSYRTTNQENWNEDLQSAKQYFDNSKLKVEVLYNNLHLYKVSLFLFSLSLILMIFAKLYPKEKLKVIVEKAALISLGAASFILTLLMIARVYILERPPVGTLYESILFVCLVCAISFFIAAWRRKQSIYIILGSVIGALLLTTAKGFIGVDTMSSLVAVLNTNFWLGTHVLCITLGYGTCLIASLVAHYDLVMRWREPENYQLQIHNLKNLKIIVILSLLLTTIGTILGAIWADQSWGRFWGWDPKENGALLIVLWLIWIIHSKISDHLNDLGFVISAAYLSVIVALAWFGVNLLNVGLHSYGFISGVASGLFIFCAMQTFILLILYILIRKRRTA